MKTITITCDVCGAMMITITCDSCGHSMEENFGYNDSLDLRLRISTSPIGRTYDVRLGLSATILSLVPAGENVCNDCYAKAKKQITERLALLIEKDGGRIV